MFFNRIKSGRAQESDKKLGQDMALAMPQEQLAEILPSPEKIRGYMTEANSRFLSFEKWYSLYYYLQVGTAKKMSKKDLAFKVGVSQITLRNMRPYIEGDMYGNQTAQFSNRRP